MCRSSATIASAIRGWERNSAAPSPATTRIVGNFAPDRIETRDVVAVGMGDHDEIGNCPRPVEPETDFIGCRGDPRLDQRG